MLELTNLSSTGKLTLGIALSMLVGGLILLGRLTSRSVVSESEFLIADRKVPLLLSILALLATWFGSSSVIESSSKMYQGGVSQVLLDPFACGATLILTGLVFAGRFWNAKVATVADLFRKEFGQSSERLSCVIQVPSFFLWIGSQFLAMGQLLESTMDIPLWIAILISAIVTLGIVIWGGMWTVTWANSVMILLSIASLLVLFVATSLAIGQGDPLRGFLRVIETAPDGHLKLDASSPSKLLSIASVLVIGLLGNVPGQDIQQRVASAKTASTARWMCIIAGMLYLLLGLVPLYLGLAARTKFGDRLQESELPINQIAGLYLSQPLQILLVVGMFCLCLSVAAGATLSQASIVSQNLIKPLLGNRSASMWLVRSSVVIVIAGSLGVAYSGESIMELLELSLVIVLVSLFVPMAIALFFPSSTPRPWVGIVSILTGFSAWLLGLWFEDSLRIPASLIGLLASALAGFLAMHRASRVHPRPSERLESPSDRG
jgi:Na+/proline symporter